VGFDFFFSLSFFLVLANYRSSLGVPLFLRRPTSPIHFLPFVDETLHFSSPSPHSLFLFTAPLDPPPQLKTSNFGLPPPGAFSPPWPTAWPCDYGVWVPPQPGAHPPFPQSGLTRIRPFQDPLLRDISQESPSSSNGFPQSVNRTATRPPFRVGPCGLTTESSSHILSSIVGNFSVPVFGFPRPVKTLSFP